MSLTTYYLLDCLYCNLHRKIFFFCLHGKSSTSTGWKNEIHRCVLCVRWVGPAISFSYSLSPPKLLAADFGLLLALHMPKRSVWLHLVRKECFKKTQSAGVQTMSEDMELDWGTPPRCVGKPRAHPRARAPLSSTDYFGVMVFPWNLYGSVFSFPYPTAKGT